MSIAFAPPTWDKALRHFTIHLKAVRAAKTARFYPTRLTALTKWALAQQIPLKKFGKRHLDSYLSFRQCSGVVSTLTGDLSALDVVSN